MGAVPRHIFVDEAMAHRSYETQRCLSDITKPSPSPLVALMTQLLCEVKPRQVLEVGTGSGYQTAVLSYFAIGFGIERISALTSARKNASQRCP